MGRVVYYEICKCMQQRFLKALFCLIIFLEIILMWVHIYGKNTYGYSVKDVANVYREIEKRELLPEQGIDEYSDVYTEVAAQIDGVRRYPEYWEEIMTGGRSIVSVLKKDTEGYSNRNQKKIQRVYKKLENLEIDIDVSEAVHVVTKQPVLDSMLLLWVYCCILFLITDERHKGYYKLTNTMEKGGADYKSAKYVTVLGNGAIGTGIGYGCSYLMAEKLLGFGRLSRSIQSVYGYQQCPWKITVGEYLFAFLLLKALGIMAASSILFWVAVAEKNILQTILCTLAGITVSWVLWWGVHIHSTKEILHFFNVFYVLDTDYLLSTYYNLDMFGYPLNQNIIAVIFFTGCVFLGFCSIGKKNRENVTRMGVRQKKDLKRRKLYIPQSVVGFEVYKLWICDKGLLLMVLGLSVGCIFANNEHYFTDGKTAAYEQYCEKAQGKLTVEKEKFLKTEMNRLEKILESGEEDNVYIYQMEGLKQVYEQYEILKKRQNEGKSVSMISQTGLERYFSPYTEKVNGILAGILSLVLVCAETGLLTREMETGVERLLVTMPKGRRIYRAKYGVVAGYAILASMCVYLPYTCRAMQYYGTLHFTESINCLTFLEKNMPDISIGVLIILYCLCRMCGSILVSSVIFLLAKVLKKKIVVFGFSVCFLLFPVLTFVLGITGEWGILTVITGNAVIMLL